MEIDLNHIKEFVIFSGSVLVRVSIVLSMMPIFGNRMIPARIKIAISLAISIFLLTHGNLSMPQVSYFILLINDVVLALIISVTLNLVFEVFIIGGQIISMQSGLGFATFVDPSTGSATPVISQFYMYCIMLIFFSLDGHLAFINLLMKSYMHGGFLLENIDKNFFEEFIQFSAIIFSESLFLVMPAIIGLLLANISLALLTRAVPQLNVFSVGFPITLILGVIMVFATCSLINPIFSKNLEFGINFLHRVI